MNFDIEEYEKNGFFLLKNFLNKDESNDLKKYSRKRLSTDFDKGSLLHKKDKNGKVTLLSNWNSTLNNDVFSLIARDKRLVSLSKLVLGVDIYVYSHKITMKNPFEGGAWEWHQDFGYWHDNGCLEPSMLSIWIAIDDSTKSNGCLEVYEESHKLGRLNHIRRNGQTCLDENYLADLKSRYKHSFIEMKSGDALIFHCNLLHASSENISDKNRWGFIASYNKSSNCPSRNKRDYGNYEELMEVPEGYFMKYIN